MVLKCVTVGVGVVSGLSCGAIRVPVRSSSYEGRELEGLRRWGLGACGAEGKVYAGVFVYSVDASSIYTVKKN